MSFKGYLKVVLFSGLLVFASQAMAENVGDACTELGASKMSSDYSSIITCLRDTTGGACRTNDGGWTGTCRYKSMTSSVGCVYGGAKYASGDVFSSAVAGCSKPGVGLFWSKISDGTPNLVQCRNGEIIVVRAGSCPAYEDAHDTHGGD